MKHARFVGEEVVATRHTNDGVVDDQHEAFVQKGQPKCTCISYHPVGPPKIKSRFGYAHGDAAFIPKSKGRPNPAQQFHAMCDKQHVTIFEVRLIRVEQLLQ